MSCSSFKALKQNLKIKTFAGTSPNAVKTQIRTALISMLLLRYLIGDQHRPDLMLLDVQMPLAGGVEVLVEARRWSADTKIIVLTGISVAGKVGDLVAVGVDGLFSKATPNEDMYAHIGDILAGKRFVAPYFTKILSEQAKQTSLTDRERQVLHLIVAGRSNKEIANFLAISVKTVDRHRTGLMQKLDVHSLAQLISYALQHGLMDASTEL